MDKQKREIKFRAWDKKHKSMIGHSDIIDYQEGCLALISLLLLGDKTMISFHPLTNDKITMDDLELMQYTGLKDKNGKEIYEGDIVNIIHDGCKKCGEGKYNEKNIVAYRAGAFRLFDPIYLDPNGSLWGSTGSYPDDLGELSDEGSYGDTSFVEVKQLNHIEIIGNIHESPVDD